MAIASELSKTPLPDQAIDYTLAANPLIGIRDQDIFESASKLFEQTAINPALAAKHCAAYLGELGRIAAGASQLAPDARDKRFADPAWKDSVACRTLAQSYLAWGGALTGFIDGVRMDKRDAERSHFIASLLIDAVAPTNFIGGNPTALKKWIDTGGASLVQGFENFARDLAHNGGLPAQVDKGKLAVGENLATTPGAVVYRSPVLELIQYAPLMDEVHARPLLIVPPQINKFYVFDLVAEKSIIQFALKGGLQTFAISWKNPTRAEAEFALDTYVGAIEEAVDVMREITGSPDVNLWGSCSGGITTSTILPISLRAASTRSIRRPSPCACSIWPRRATPLPGYLPRRNRSHASQLAGVLEGRELARMFAWLRPNDLIWNYWVNNYLLGNDPPAYDILYWNNDTTRLPARLHADFLDLIGTYPFVEAGRLNIAGRALDMRKVDIDSYVVAGITDHIAPWQSCYKTARLYGERATFVLANSGHIQSLINPPDNRKVHFSAGAAPAETAEDWMSSAEKHAGSWWPHWPQWIAARSGETKPAPAARGNTDLPVLDAAPGRYVMEA